MGWFDRLSVRRHEGVADLPSTGQERWPVALADHTAVGHPVTRRGAGLQRSGVSPDDELTTLKRLLGG
jgi:hypothetical protein